MQKLTTILVILALLPGVAACGGAAGDPHTVGTGESSMRADASPVGPAGGSVIPVSQLILGTMQLEGTELAVTPEQAGTLLTLWKAYRSLTESETAAQAEIQAILEQIKDAMTPEQMEAIQSMDFSQGEVAARIEELGLLPEESPDGSGEEFFPGGGPPWEGSPGNGFRGGQGPQFEGQISPEQMATAQALRERRGGFSSRMGSILVIPLIDLLMSKSAG